MIARIMLVSISFSFFFFTLFFFVVPRPASAEFRTPPHGMIFWEGHGNFGGLSRQSYELIDSSEDWNRFWSRVKDQKPPVPPDFEKERGVVIYTGERQTAGFSVVFLPPRLKGSRLFVGYCIVPPKRPEAQVISRAWGMVIVPRTPRIYVVQRCSGIKNAGSGTSENDALSEAARLGKGDTLRRLLLAGIPINGLDSMGKTALIEAVIGQQIEAVRLLLRRGAKVNTPMRDGSTALFMSAYYGGREIARILLVHGANPNIQARGVAPSTLAAYFGHLNVLRVLLSHGAGLDQPDGNGYTPLFSAIRGRQSKTALALLTLGADPDRLGPNGTSPLLLAVQKGEPAVIKALLSEKDQVDLQNREGTTPLMAASRDPEVVKLLLDHGANPNISGSDGVTALVGTVLAGNKPAVDLLLVKGANPNIRTPVGSPLLISLVNGYLDIAMDLISHGADVNTSGPEGLTPLIATAGYGTDLIPKSSFSLPGAKVPASEPDIERVVGILLTHGANPNTPTDSGLTALLGTILSGREKLAVSLLNKGADPNACLKRNGLSLVMAAILQHEGKILRDLVNHGANVNVAIKDGTTPLILASSDGNIAFVRFLLAHGANPKLQTLKGHDALWEARTHRHPRVAALIRKAMKAPRQK